ncbi:MAG: acetate--CoA ligase family protein [Methanomassiliicoccales archaeon]
MKAEAARLIRNVLDEGRTILLEHEAKAVLESYGIPSTKEILCKNVEEAIQAAELIGYPVVMKIVSPQIVHKTEFGGVKLNIRSTEDVKSSFEDMISRIKRTLGNFDFRGVLISETSRGHELIVGSMKDPQFGQMIMLGTGGVNVEVFKDVSYRLAPVDEIDALEMLSELKGKRLLDGYRGMEKANIDAIVSMLINVSHILVDFSEIYEMDLNPVFANSKGVVVADARIILSKDTS